jgi:hypothetical protein
MLCRMEGGNLMPEDSSAASKNVVVLLHGIRTHAPWFPLVQRILEPRGIKVHPIRYGRFDLIRFMVPGPWRRKPIEIAERKLEPIILRAEKHGQHVTVIAHSNGSYVITKLLQKRPSIVLENLILCGSVVESQFDWQRVWNQIRGSIVNEYGVRDPWPAVAHSLSWGFGYSGTHGFGDPVTDRIHDLGHDYFTEEFVERYWLPIIESGEVVPSTRRGETLPKPPGWFLIWEFPWKWVILALVVAGIAARAIAFSAGGEGGWPGPGPVPSEGERKLVATVEFRPDPAASWRSATLYPGPPVLDFTSDPSPVTTAASSDGEEDSQADQGTAAARIYASYGIDLFDRKRRGEVLACLGSVDRLRSCKADIQAGTLDVLSTQSGAVPSPEGIMPYELAAVNEAVRDLGTDRLAEAPGPMQLRISIRNDTGPARLITALRFKLVGLHKAEGDGTNLSQPVTIKDVAGGKLAIADLLRLDCQKPDLRPGAEVRMPSPIGVPSNGLAPIVIVLDPILRRPYFGKAIYADSTGSKGDASVASVCRETAVMRLEDVTGLAPAWRNAFSRLKQPIYEGDFVAVADVSVLVDGSWTRLGLLNFDLP